MNIKRKRNKSVKRKRLEIAKEAASRTLNANGKTDLPPLPVDKNGGLDTLFSHRYGVLPYGNIYMSNELNGDFVRHGGLGPLLLSLNDEEILSVLQFLDAGSLGRLSQCSRYLYVAGHHDDLWRDLTLRKYGKTGFSFTNSWKDTFISTDIANMIKCAKDDTTTAKISFSFEPHKPIKIKNIYSDTFFRSWLCCTFTLQKSWLSVQNVDTMNSESMSTEKFLEYEENNIPLLIKGATKDWPALQKWNKEYLIKQSQNVSFRATSGAAPLPANYTIENYSKYCDEVSEEAPLYLFDRTFAHNCPSLLDDYEEALKTSCPYFDHEAKHGHDLFSLLGKGKRPDHRWIIMGPSRSFSNFHIDPNCTHAWNAPIVGRKRWIFYPPGTNPPGVYPSPNGDDVVMPISLGEWFLTHYNDHVKQRNNPDISKRPLECTACPGDILFVPHGWWHCVLNIDDGMSVALTQNYVSQSNLPDVLRFLRTKQNQISGCRDRAEAIQPIQMYDEFTSRLKECRPDLLMNAQRLADEGWHCAAWTDDPIKGLKEGGEKNHTKKKVAKTTGTSILQLAKDSQMNGVGGKKDVVNSTSSCGFSFSFL